MRNVALAQAFEEIADYLELSGDNPFKIRAYRRAAETVLDYPLPIEDASDEELENLEGLGAATVAKTREWGATGQIRLLEHLRREKSAGFARSFARARTWPQKSQAALPRKKYRLARKIRRRVGKRRLKRREWIRPENHREFENRFVPIVRTFGANANNARARFGR